MYNVFSGAFECVRPSDRLCPSVRQILSVCPTDFVRPSDRCPSVRQICHGFCHRFCHGFGMGFLYLPPPKGERKAPEGGHFASSLQTAQERKSLIGSPQSPLLLSVYSQVAEAKGEQTEDGPSQSPCKISLALD